jgi:hypothetical protein
LAIEVNLGRCYYFARQYDGHWSCPALGDGPTFWMVHEILGQTNRTMGRFMRQFVSKSHTTLADEPVQSGHSWRYYERRSRPADAINGVQLDKRRALTYLAH